VVNKKSAPQKHVVSIDRVGEWGKRVYHHKLECGHVEVRNRASTAPKIACTWCVIGEQKGKELKSLTLISPPITEEVWDFYDDTANQEIDVAKLRAGISLAIGCPQESVEIVSEIDDDGILRASFVTVLLDIRLAEKIAGIDTGIIDIQ